MKKPAQGLADEGGRTQVIVIALEDPIGLQPGVQENQDD